MWAADEFGGRAMKILHVLDHSIPLHSGYAFRTRAILEGQRALGWTTFQVTGPKHSASVGEEGVDGFHFYRTRARGPLAGLPPFDQLACIRGLRIRLAELVERLRPDLIHAHSPALNGVAALAAARRAGVPLVYEVRAFWEDAAVDHGTCREGGPRYRLTRALETHVLRRAAAVATICDGLRNDLLGRGLAPDRVTVVPNAVDPQRFRTERRPDPALRARLGLGAGPVLGFLGSFYAYEGLALLIEALPAVLEWHAGVRVLLVGGGPQAQVLERQVHAAGLAGKVLLVGRVPHDEVQGWYDLVDVFVYPRLSMRLTELVTPLKPLEALAQGRVVVASDVGGHRELIRHGETGVLFPAGDAQALARALLDVLDAPERWAALGAAARGHIEQERSWAASVARYETVYRGALSMPRVAFS
jgi:PEP-CTERM/exosortase A-associated glycosyltransferase